jgi:uncharacterized C2H2 Zn-finger protein
MATFSNIKNPSFSCEICQFITNNKKDYAKHVLTRKHINKGNPQHISPILTQDHTCSQCNKKYESRSGLWRHVKKCILIEEKQPQITLRNKNSIIQ